ncbi:MAG: formylglycine-generating enzyme family protein, partial [Phycisphaerae bacterium]
LDDERSMAESAPINPYWMGATEVNWKTFGPFLDNASSKSVVSEQQAALIRRAIQSAPPGQRDRVAVGFISLSTARAFCDWINRAAATADPPRHYRLPTEREWEYACRAGNAGRFCYGNNARYARFFANCNGNVAPVHIVAQRMPNAYGLFDMHGGLWEWCDTPYPPELVTEPELAKRELWVYRGGAYYSPAVRCRSTQRNRGQADSWTDYHGFRLVMELLEL